jgi:multisubunit Na+/H+ antiporter MnhB subunit
MSSAPSLLADVGLLPHLGGPVVASFVGWSLAVVLYRYREPLRAVGDRLPRVSAAAAWERMLAGVAWLGEAFSRRWENGSLRWYLAGTVLTLPLLVAHAFGVLGVSYADAVIHLSEMPWYAPLFAALLISAAMAAVQARTRLAAAIASSTVGFLVAMLYVVYRSPDILLTQILIETVSTIFVLLVLIHLPAFPAEDLSPGARLLNVSIAASVGLAMSVLLLLAMTPGLRETNNIATQPGGLLSLALAEGGGTNAVNVLIVDIRAMDTNGEIAVLVVVGLCIYGLLRARRRSA